MSNAQNRRDGAVETLTELRPDVKFLAEQPGDWDEAKMHGHRGGLVPGLSGV